VDKECTFCGRSGGPMIPATGSAIDEEGTPKDWVCPECFSNISNAVIEAGDYVEGSPGEYYTLSGHPDARFVSSLEADWFLQQARSADKQWG